jgi:hypothetical protein
MKNRPIHENLDTSFVNLSALIKHLRRRQFVGIIKVRLNDYTADIRLKEDNQMKVSEHDQISGRIADGEEALQRLLIRAREPGGTISVFQTVESSPEDPAVNQPPAAVPKTEEPLIEFEVIEEPPPANVAVKNGNRNSDKPKTAKQTPEVTGKKALPELRPPEFVSKPVIQKNNGYQVKIKKETKPIQEKPSLPDFPFRLSNKFEDKARKVRKVGSADWQTLLNLTVELLGVIDKSLAQTNLNFTAAFRKASSEIADDYPFLHPVNGSFTYSNGQIKMTEQMNPKIFVASIIEVLRRILEKLEKNPKFFETHRSTVQRILAVMHKREKQYAKFYITQPLKKILGA